MARILIIEDEWLIAEDLKLVLQRLGHEVIGIVMSGEDGIIVTGDERPDLIFMDVQLEGDIDGIEAALCIRQKHNMPIIYCTANTDDSTVLKMATTSPKGLVMKPFSNRDIERAISPFLLNRSIESDLNDNPNHFTGLLTAN